MNVSVVLFTSFVFLLIMGVPVAASFNLCIIYLPVWLYKYPCDGRCTEIFRSGGFLQPDGNSLFYHCRCNS